MFHRSIITHRYFFALRPPPVLARQVAQAADWFDRRDAVAWDRLHLTLFILDDAPRAMPDVERTVRGIGERVAAAPVDVRLDRVVGTSRSVALRPGHVLPNLHALHCALAGLAEAAGIRERAGYRFSPHVTLGYRDGAPFSAAVAPIEWRADELVLIHSRVGQTAHDTLGRWALTGGAQLTLF